ncbi:MAG: bifunctional serine/threonine-protein kinase/formylglycine-generating enzyme family protein [Planctomycetes bacterium]|nr:bifunctional serine/threonine-protein kinase/formylglycine-generating enzyme family protein [Planctomycetota bacterium]
MTGHAEELRRVLQEFFDRRARGESPSPSEFLERFPHLQKDLGEHFETVEALDRIVRGNREVPFRETVLGDFRLEQEIGKGAFGRVFRAEQISLHRPIALKLLSAPLAQSYRTLERFRREAEIAARLRHPNLVSVYAEGEAQGYAFYAMELVEGVSLEKVLKSLRDLGISRLHSLDLRTLVRDSAPASEEGPGDPEIPHASPVRSLGYFGVVAQLVAEIADGLAYAHGQGVIHRDVKPGNILLDRALVPHLADFGLAKETGPEGLTIPGELIGTPYYLSPEIAMSGRIHVDHRTDVYSLGVTLFEMLTLRVPFPGDSSQEVLRRIVLEVPPSPRRLNPAIPRDLQVIALKAMEKNPDHRYTTAAEMAEDLRRFLHFEPIRATPPGPIRIAGRFLRRHRVAASFAAFALLVSGAAGAIHAARVARVEREATLRAAEGLERSGALAGAKWVLEGWIAKDPEERGAGEALRRVSAKVEADVDSLLVEAEEDIRRAQEDNQEHFRQLATLKLEKALALRGEEDPVLRKRMQEVLGEAEVSFLSEPSGARVFLHDVHEASGELGPPRLLGSTPLRGIPLSLGWYRAVLEIAGFGFGEHSFEVTRDGGPPTVEVTLRRTEEVVRDMVKIPAGKYRIGLNTVPIFPEVPLLELEEGTVDHPSFYIDAKEVSNAEYERFFLATGRRLPSTWDGDAARRLRRGEGDRPVTGVTWDEARAYAEWVGKRLPTEIEWEIACRGGEGWLYPWGTEFDPRRANLGPPYQKGKPGTRNDVSPAPFLPVGGLPEGRSPFGMFHMVGNAREWVWDPWRPRRGTSLAHDPWLAPGRTRVTRGGSTVFPGGKDCTCAAREPFDPAFHAMDFGFRCAKSVRE